MVSRQASIANDNRQKTDDSPAGFMLASGAYLSWGLLPLYFKSMAHISAVEITAHRIVWSLPLAALAVILNDEVRDVIRALSSIRLVMMAVVTATLVTINSGSYVWAVSNGHALDAALGYYINPLVSVLLGRLFLGETLDAPKIVATAMAATAVAILVFLSRGLPWIALVMATSWAFYALLRKVLPLSPNQGYFMEVLMLTPAALGYIMYLEFFSGTGHLLHATWTDMALLVGCGFVTAIPLLLFANGAKRLRLSTIGIMQYIAPTIVFLVAVVVFGEPLDAGRIIAFPLIWAALLLFTWAIFRKRQPASTVV